MQTVVYTLTIFLAASLLFLVQPMYAKMVLPMLGGVPAVWNTAMVFFQAALLVGYAYSHWITRIRNLRVQAIIHLCVCLLPFLSLPIAIPSTANPPSGGSPVGWLLGTMALTVGLPFFVVSTTSPLLQRWFSLGQSERARDPYFLYAASNVGSMIALFGYPLFFERMYSVKTQTTIWAWVYGLAIVMIAVSASFVWRTSTEPHTFSSNSETAERVPFGRAFRWLMLAFVPASLMMSVTTYITTDLVSAPMLWVLPLGLYLLTFSFVFARRRVVPQPVWRIVAPIFILALLIVLSNLMRRPVHWFMVGHLVAFFVVAMYCHGELAQDRPSPKSLTKFFLIIALGGVLGGSFNALVSPIIFNDVFEYPLTLILAGFLLPFTLKNNNMLKQFLDYALPMGAATAMILIFTLMPTTSRELITKPLLLTQGGLKELLLFGIPALVCLTGINRPVRFGLALAVIFMFSFLYWRKDEELLYRTRSFFGVLKVRRDSFLNANVLSHGTTTHGVQLLDPELHELPTSYYDRTGPLGDIFRQYPNVENASIAVVGLGTGSIAAYGQFGQSITYYEIDQQVLHISRDSGYFTFLKSCPAKVDFVLGDARLRMASDSRLFDLILLDAYSSDAVPMHLITLEAMKIYKRHLKPGGWISFHISNRYFNFEPEIAMLAEAVGMVCLIRDDNDSMDLNATPSKYESVWTVCLEPSDPKIEELKKDGWTTAKKSDNVSLWTDDRSSILQVFVRFGG